MAPTAQPTATPLSPVRTPRQRTRTRTRTTADAWRDAIVDYQPPAGPDGCWASGAPRAAHDDVAPGGS